MNRRIVVVSTDGGSSEDCNVYYASYLVASSATLKFDEPIFNALGFKVSKFPDLQDDDDEDSFDPGKVADYLRGLGYEVEDLNPAFIVANE